MKDLETQESKNNQTNGAQDRQRDLFITSPMWKICFDQGILNVFKLQQYNKGTTYYSIVYYFIWCQHDQINPSMREFSIAQENYG